jgi:uncharacterized membrane protein
MNTARKKLGRKQNIKNSEWLDAIREIESLVTQKELDSFTKAAIEDIKNKTVGATAAYAWSAGKDSIVLVIFASAGIQSLYDRRLQFGSTRLSRTGRKAQTVGCEVIIRGRTLTGLLSIQSMLFPQDSKAACYGFISSARSAGTILQGA